MTLTRSERLKLIKTLNAIAPEQLEMIIFTLSPPAGLIPPLPASQGQRVSALLNWASGPGGCGLAEVQQFLNEIINLNSYSNYQQSSDSSIKDISVINFQKTQDKKKLLKRISEEKREIWDTHLSDELGIDLYKVKVYLKELAKNDLIHLYKCSHQDMTEKMLGAVILSKGHITLEDETLI
ncbi:hypothetical protein [Gloeothece verrucosa]|uniref:Uncharacterized protein n=1 Tax=Gloeothece verrucosa (strain PCC 7822) TaxID=497965 RepID=E0UN13_GLOV7|nr:hypothetical protein [Gloeothece verrucosa]ADN18343.1 hypothetical protein Cyan7822_6588 [Gloeothece verrucosa PCC 7822]